MFYGYWFVFHRVERVLQYILVIYLLCVYEGIKKIFYYDNLDFILFLVVLFSSACTRTCTHH